MHKFDDKIEKESDMYRVLIIEDDEVIARAVCENLQSWGYEAQIAADFRNVMKDFAAFEPHLVLLDISLPFFNGYHWCTEIRKVSRVPIIFISSASGNMNIVMAMNMGGDDFISKPFDITVLTAKVQALLRRTYDFSNGGALVEHKGVILNLLDTAVSCGDGKAELTKNEFRIMQILMENRGRVVSRDEIMTALWENDSFVDENTLTVNITRLRKKLESIGITDYIITRKGMGYIV